MLKLLEFGRKFSKRRQNRFGWRCQGCGLRIIRIATVKLPASRQICERALLQAAEDEVVVGASCDGEVGGNCPQTRDAIRVPPDDFGRRLGDVHRRFKQWREGEILRVRHDVWGELRQPKLFSPGLQLPAMPFPSVFAAPIFLDPGQ